MAFDSRGCLFLMLPDVVARVWNAKDANLNNSPNHLRTLSLDLLGAGKFGKIKRLGLKGEQILVALQTGMLGVCAKEIRKLVVSDVSTLLWVPLCSMSFPKLDPTQISSASPPLELLPFEVRLDAPSLTVLDVTLRPDVAVLQTLNASVLYMPDLRAVRMVLSGQAASDAELFANTMEKFTNLMPRLNTWISRCSRLLDFLLRSAQFQPTWIRHQSDNIDTALLHSGTLEALQSRASVEALEISVSTSQLHFLSHRLIDIFAVALTVLYLDHPASLVPVLAKMTRNLKVDSFLVLPSGNAEFDDEAEWKWTVEANL
jgi:hypothetical protein